MKRKSSSGRFSRGWHQKPFHATGQGGRSTDGRKGASAQPGLASPQLPGTNEKVLPETRGQSTVLWYSPRGPYGAAWFSQQRFGIQPGPLLARSLQERLGEPAVLYRILPAF